MRMRDGKVVEFVEAVHVETRNCGPTKQLLSCMFDQRRFSRRGAFVCAACGRGLVGDGTHFRPRCRVCKAKVVLTWAKPMDNEAYRRLFWSAKTTESVPDGSQF